MRVRAPYRNSALFAFTTFTDFFITLYPTTVYALFRTYFNINRTSSPFWADWKAEKGGTSPSKPPIFSPNAPRDSFLPCICSPKTAQQGPNFGPSHKNVGDFPKNVGLFPEYLRGFTRRDALPHFLCRNDKPSPPYSSSQKFIKMPQYDTSLEIYSLSVFLFQLIFCNPSTLQRTSNWTFSRTPFLLPS